MSFWSEHRGIIYGVRTIRVYELIQDLPYGFIELTVSDMFALCLAAFLSSSARSFLEKGQILERKNCIHVRLTLYRTSHEAVVS